MTKSSSTPSLFARCALAVCAMTLSGAALAVSAGKGLAIGAVLGAIGGVVGAFAGYYVRHGLVTQMEVPDFVIAVIEDLLAISGGLYVVSRM